MANFALNLFGLLVGLGARVFWTRTKVGHGR